MAETRRTIICTTILINIIVTAWIIIWNSTIRVIMSKAHQIQFFWIDHWWFLIVEDSYRPNDVQIEYSVFWNSKDTSYNISSKNGLFCTHTFNYELRYNFWGKKTNLIARTLLKYKKRVIRIITNLRTTDACRELFKKTGNITLIISIYFFTINICEKKQTLVLY